MSGNRLCILTSSAAALLLVALGFLAACGGEDDVGKVSKELSNRLTEALAFDGGEVKDGEAPPENSGDSSIPQIAELDAPASLSIGESFKLTITGQVEDPETVVGAVVAVELADKYIEIESAYDVETNVMELNGSIDSDEELKGYDFNIYVGLLDRQGRVGNYYLWELNVHGSDSAEYVTEDDNSRLKCQEICEFNDACELMGTMTIDDCLQSCEENTDQALSQDGPECVNAISALLDCAIPLGCDGYLSVMSSDDPSNCRDQSVSQQENCPTYEFMQ